MKALKKNRIAAVLTLAASALFLAQTALAAYPPDATRTAGPQASEVHVTSSNGFNLAVMVVGAEGESSDAVSCPVPGKEADTPEMVLFLADPQGEIVQNARVHFRVTDPEGNETHLPVTEELAGYTAPVKCASAGTYQVVATVVTGTEFLQEKFQYTVR